MSNENKPKKTNNNQKSDGRFKTRHIHHNPQEESSRAKFGLQNATSDNDRKANDGHGE